jgi:hypothetical protein
MQLKLKNEILIISNKKIKIELFKINDFKNNPFLELNFNNSLKLFKNEILRLKHFDLIDFKKINDFNYTLKFNNKNILDEFIFKKLIISADNYNNFIITIN